MNILISPGSFGKVSLTAVNKIKEAGYEVTMNPYGKTLTKVQTLELLKDKVGIIAGTEALDKEVLDANPQLKYICRLGTGMDNVDQVETEMRNIQVDNTPDAHVDGVAELCFAGILDLHRQVSFAHHNVKNGIWKKPMGRLLQGKTLGIIGLGRVSKKMIVLMQPFNLRVIAIDMYWDKEFADKYNVEQVDKKTLLKESDIVSLHLPFTQENKYTIASEELKFLKTTAMLVNTSRGGLIDEQALEIHLKNNPKTTAYLDTFEVEPYNGNLINLENVLFTPHIGSYAEEVRLKMEMECADKLMAYFKK
jgi:D-3-phosphoglycerate dehydrogenase